jgi:hypothetical protein
LADLLAQPIFAFSIKTTNARVRGAPERLLT